MSSKGLTFLINHSDLIEDTKYLNDYKLEESDDDDDNLDISFDTTCSLDMTYDNSYLSKIKSTTTINSSNSSSNRSKLKNPSKYSLSRSDLVTSSLHDFVNIPSPRRTTKANKRKSNCEEKLQIFFSLLSKLVKKFNKSFEFNRKFKSYKLSPKTTSSISNLLYYKKNYKKKIILLSFMRTFKQFESASKVLVELFSENQVLSEQESFLFDEEDERQCLINRKSKKSRPEIVKCKKIETNSNKVSPLSSSISLISSISSTEAQTTPKLVNKSSRKRNQNTTNLTSSSSSINLDQFNESSMNATNNQTTKQQKKHVKKKLNFKLNSNDDNNRKDKQILNNNSSATSTSDEFVNNLVNKCNKYEQSIRSLNQELKNIKKNNDLKFSKEFKLMARSEYEALKLQLNMFREDYRMEHNEKLHLRIYYEEKLRNLESSNAELTNKLNKLILLSETFESFDSSLPTFYD